MTAVKTKRPNNTVRASGISRKEAEHLRLCRDNLTFYAKHHLWISDKQGRVKPFEFNKAQKTVHAKIQKQARAKGYVRVIILKARQEGISTYCAGRLFRRVHMTPNQKVMIVAHQQRPASVLFEMYDRYFRNIDPEFIDPRREGEKGLRLLIDNDSQIVVQTANNVHGSRGSTVQALHASELAFWEKPEDTYMSVAQTIPDEGSEIIIESTANGVGNFFHQKWLAAESGNDEFVAIFLPWWIHEEYQARSVNPDLEKSIKRSADPFEREAQDTGIKWEGKFHKLTVKQLAWRRRTIADKLAGSERAFRQEYPATAREAFLTSGAGFFEGEALEKYERAAVPHEIRGTFYEKLVPDEKTKETRKVYKIGRDERGYCKVWETPKPNAHYAIGADTAEGKLAAATENTFSDPEGERGGRDFSSADVVKVWWDEGQIRRKQVAQLHGRMAPEVFAAQLHMLGFFYGYNTMAGRMPALIGVERNHWSGEAVLNMLQRTHKYPNLFYAVQEGRRYNRPTPVLGWVTSSATRGPLLEGLAMLVREGMGTEDCAYAGIEIPCIRTIDEFYTFVRGEDGKPEAQEGAHDDRVISLAVAAQIARTISYEPPSGDVPDYMDDIGDSPTGWM